jgi:nucleotide-binding universal stress UspA family protein
MNLWHVIETAVRQNDPLSRPSEVHRFDRSEDVLRHLHQSSSPVPVCLVGTEVAFEPPLQILAPVDFLEGTEASLALVRALSLVGPSKVTLVTVLGPSRARGEAEGMVEDATRALLVHARNAGFETSEVELSVLESVPDRSISEILLEEIWRKHADLVVLASHGKGALARLFVGSTTEALLKHAVTPVLVIPRTAAR